MKKNILFLLSVIVLFACNNEKKPAVNENIEVRTDSVTSSAASENRIVLQRNGIFLTEIQDSPDLSNAKLTLNTPVPNAHVKPGNIKFSYTIDNYQLGNQTPDADAKVCANSAKGQHIHFIVNNAPYKAYYEPEFETEFRDGNYLVLSFLSRSYHESVKHKQAYDLRAITIGKPLHPEQYDMSAPYLFYSRPKGSYIGEKEIKNVLLDFYLVNTTLSPNGNKVKATIDSTTFIITKWAPYLIGGLFMGMHTVKLDLIDKDGNPVPGPFNNSEERTFKLFEKEPTVQ